MGFWMSFKKFGFLSAIKESWIIGLFILFVAIGFSGCGGFTKKTPIKVNKAAPPGKAKHPLHRLGCIPSPPGNYPKIDKNKLKSELVSKGIISTVKKAPIKVNKVAPPVKATSVIVFPKEENKTSTAGKDNKLKK